MEKRGIIPFICVNIGNYTKWKVGNYVEIDASRYFLQVVL